MRGFIFTDTPMIGAIKYLWLRATRERRIRKHRDHLRAQVRRGATGWWSEELGFHQHVLTNKERAAFLELYA